MSNNLTNDVTTKIAVNATKLSTQFTKIKHLFFEYQNNLVFLSTCLHKDCSETYIGERNGRTIERIIDHNKRDKNSHVLTHSKPSLFKRNLSL